MPTSVIITAIICGTIVLICLVDAIKNIYTKGDKNNGSK